MTINYRDCKAIKYRRHAHHEGYISWDEYLSIQSELHRNWFRSSTRGSPREGSALLQGIVWCGLCGAKMHVNSYSMHEKRKPSCLCHHAYTQGAAHTCQSMSSAPLEKLVVGLFLDAMAPAQIEIAMQTVEKLKEERRALQKQWDQQLVQARYDSQLAQRHYDAVDPDNRLEAAELEQRWNVKLEAVQTLEHAYTEALQEDRFSISVEEAKDMKHLAKDLPRVWHAATTTDCERKQLLRLVIDEVQLHGITNPGKIDVSIGWRSGAVTHSQIDPFKVGAWPPVLMSLTIIDTLTMVREYSPSRFIPDAPHGCAFSLDAHDNSLQLMPLNGGLKPAPAGRLRRAVNPPSIL